MKYFIQVFGCQSNKSDSERIAGDYQSRGWEEATDWRDADQVVVDTCAVRQSAEDRATGFLLNVVAYFDEAGKKRPKIILTGCMTHHGEAKIRELLPMVDEVLPITEVGFNQAAIRKDKLHAWIPISQGCNSFCTYCIVPYSRGREASRSKESIMEEVLRLAGEGYTELTLLGQNVNSWGLEKVGIGLRKLLMDQTHKLKFEDIPSNQSQYYDGGGEPPFVQLLKDITAVEGIVKVRFMTSNPWDFPDSLVNEIAYNEKIDKFIHLPIQSGSNAVLSRMNRGYTKEDYLAVVAKLRKSIPEVELGTDIIVGFGGETEAEFQETVELAKTIGWKVGFVARYSPRPGTAAWRLFPDDIPALEKKRRWQILEDIINQPNLGSKRPKVIK
jgi:tRNA-2-methylthio-N6-dimethylallyladenosine synthase